MAEFHAQIWNFENQPFSWKLLPIEKICSISTSWVRKRVYVQLLELWPMTKLALKQSVKAHGPLVKKISYIPPAPSLHQYGL